MKPGLVLSCLAVGLLLAAVPSSAAVTRTPSFAADTRYALPTGANEEAETVAIGDLNADGKPDLVTASSDPSIVSVLLNKGGGSFRVRRDYIVGAGAWSVAIGDLNGDGKPDLAVADLDLGAVSVLMNKGDGTFGARREYATAPGPLSIAVGDLNGDGKPDVVTNSGDTVSVLLNRGDGTFAARQDYPVAGGGDNVSVAIGDLNGDGKPDIVTAGGTVSVLLNKGDGTFAVRRDYPVAGSAAAIGDLNGDGKPDLALANGSSVSVLLNHGDGSFGASHEYPLLHPPGWDTAGSESLAIGDLNGDGKPDLVTGNVDVHVSLLLNGGAGSFRTTLDLGAQKCTPSYTDRSVAISDLNGDGRPDLAVVGDGVCVLFNRPGLCNVQDVGELSVTGATRLLARGHCRVGRIRYAHAAFTKRGRVSAQKPGFGRVLRQGSKVNLVVSLGKRK
ncbi:MAG: FG-GAP-like repeat-containing protein [Gaiellaceae bacterium]